MWVVRRETKLTGGLECAISTNFLHRNFKDTASTPTSFVPKDTALDKLATLPTETTAN